MGKLTPIIGRMTKTTDLTPGELLLAVLANWPYPTINLVEAQKLSDGIMSQRTNPKFAGLYAACFDNGDAPAAAETLEMTLHMYRVGALLGSGGTSMTFKMSEQLQRMYREAIEPKVGGRPIKELAAEVAGVVGR